MASTFISTDPGDIDRWAAERDVVPVREGATFALVEEGQAGPDQERLHWDEFHAERDPDTVVVVWRERTGHDSMEIVDRAAILDRAAIDDGDREAVRASLADGETVTVEFPTGTAEPSDPTATGERAGRERATDPHTTGRTDPAERDVGKIVVAANGDEVGMVTDVDDDAFAVDPHPGMTKRAFGKLGWTHAEDGDVTVAADRVDRITPQVIRLLGDADEAEFRETTAGH